MKQIFSMVLFMGMFLPTRSQPSADDILGEWLSAKKDSKVLIFKQGKKYYGRLTWGTGGPEKDVNNPKPELRNRDVIGLVILNDFIYEQENSWEDGTIYDPREGKTYSCKMTLKEKDKLNIRGYVGISLLGRTETWTRVK